MSEVSGKTVGYKVRCPYCYQSVRAVAVRVVLPSGGIERYDSPQPHQKPNNEGRCPAGIETRGQGEQPCS